MVRNESEENIALLSGTDVSINDEKRQPVLGDRSLWLSAPWANAAIYLLAIIAVSDLIFLAYACYVVRYIFAPTDVHQLELANPYIGLKELYESGLVNASKIDPILVLPLVNAQVYGDAPSRLSAVGEHDYWIKEYGTFTPHERRFEVNENIHTLVQFRAIDFGMEECSIVIHLPNSTQDIEGDSLFHLREGSVIDVYALDAQRPLDVSGLSWSTRPQRQELMETIPLSRGIQSTVAVFPCPWGSLHTFEVACAAGALCDVDVWSSQNKTWGAYMYQHQTV